MVGGALIDGAIFIDGHQGCVYFEEVPEDVFHGYFPQSKRVTMAFHAGGHANPVGGRYFKKVRLVEQAPSAHPFHAVLEYWPPGAYARYQAERIARSQAGMPAMGADQDTHPSSVWPAYRATSRFHFKADRLTDYTNVAQIPLLERFLREVEVAIWSPNATGSLSSDFHEFHDRQIGFNEFE